MCINNKTNSGNNDTHCFNRMCKCDYFYAALYELGYTINCSVQSFYFIAFCAT